MKIAEGIGWIFIGFVILACIGIWLWIAHPIGKIDGGSTIHSKEWETINGFTFNCPKGFTLISETTYGTYKKSGTCVDCSKVLSQESPDLMEWSICDARK